MFFVTRYRVGVMVMIWTCFVSTPKRDLRIDNEVSLVLESREYALASGSHLDTNVTL